MTKAQSTAQQIKELKIQLKEAQANEIKYTQKDLKLTAKIGGKGTVNIYGLGKNPVCLYMSQLVKLAKMLNDTGLQEFLVTNKDSLAIKKEE